MSDIRQRCKKCGARGFNFHVSDSTWERVVDRQYLGKVLCLSCFDDMAAERGIPYADEITTLYFAGSRSVFYFDPTVKLDLG
jgi:hypothetical protein